MLLQIGANTRMIVLAIGMISFALRGSMNYEAVSGGNPDSCTYNSTLFVTEPRLVII